MNIPKRIFFIWLGDQIPLYAKFSVKEYKKINPGFEIIFINYKIIEIEQIFFSKKITNKYDQLLLNAINEIIFHKDKYKQIFYRKLINGQILYYHNRIRFIQLLADVFRLEILNEFGGIYIDCDTFPLKPFDDYILLKPFIVQSYLNLVHDKNVYPHIILDNYFIGTTCTTKIYSFYQSNLQPVLQNNNKWWININYIFNRKRFYSLQLKQENIIKTGNFYIEHYCDGTWKRKNGIIRTPICKLDKFI